MIDPFQELLQVLGRHLGIPLHPDKRGACKLNIRDLIHIQLEFDPSQERILLACFICELPPGKLRENILRDALKANYPFPEMGAFAYCERNNKLSLFRYVSMPGLTGDKAASILASFSEKAIQWKEAIEKGQTASLVASRNPQNKPFDLKP